MKTGLKTIVGVVLVAAFGGVFSNLIDIAKRLQMDTVDLPSSTYLLGCLIWAVLGAGVALLWGEKNLKKVFYLGVGLPSLLQLNIGNLSQTPSSDQGISLKSHISALVPSAYAQPPGMSVQGRTIIFTKTGRSPNFEGYRAVFYTSDNRRRMAISIDFSNQSVAVPADAAYLTVEFRGSQSRQRIFLPAQANTLTNIEVDIQKRGWSGFLRSIGFRSASAYAVYIRKI